MAAVVTSATNGPSLPDAERSIAKPVSLPELSLHVRCTWACVGAVAPRSLGGDGAACAGLIAPQASVATAVIETRVRICRCGLHGVDRRMVAPGC